MAKQVVMPQMGESVAEGTIVRWLKKVGDAVERDEPLFEISTDKVDAEIPSPAAGVLSDVKVKEGETVPINTVVGVIDETAAKPAAAARHRYRLRAGARRTRPASLSHPAHPWHLPHPLYPSPLHKGTVILPDVSVPTRPSHLPRSRAHRLRAAPRATCCTCCTACSRRPHPTAPSLAQALVGSRGARTAAVASRAKNRARASRRRAQYCGQWRGRPRDEERHPRVHRRRRSRLRAAGSGARLRARRSGGQAGGQLRLLAANPSATAGLAQDKYERTAMSVMRRKIAEHMVMSKRTSPHVHSAFEIDFTKVDEIRKAKKAEYEKAGGKLTYMSFITKACAEALKKVPIVNASVDGADIIFKKDINIGVAVALDWGLIVPVVKNADKMSLLEISKAIADVAARAREKKLKPEDVQGGTFTITNPGVFGALFGMPIISQPQVAIVGVGAVEKRPVVLDDAVTIRLRAYMTIGYDHRVIDGAIADEFMQVVKKMIENWDAGAA